MRNRPNAAWRGRNASKRPTNGQEHQHSDKGTRVRSSASASARDNARDNARGKGRGTHGNSTAR